MNPWIKAEYERLRRNNWRAVDALRAARVKDRFEDLQNERLVRFRFEPECDMYEFGEGEEPFREEITERINREGYWIVCTDYLNAETEEWEQAEAIGGFIGDDWQDSGYDVDLRLAAIEAHETCVEQAAQREADALESRATFACVV